MFFFFHKNFILINLYEFGSRSRSLELFETFLYKNGVCAFFGYFFLKQFPNLDNKHSITKFQQATRKLSGYLTYDAGITPGCIKIIIYDQLI